MVPVAKILTAHVGTSGNSKNYAPVFVNQDNRDPSPGSEGAIGYYTPNYFGVHNPTASGVSATLWTVYQGTSGTGAQVYIPAGGVFYSSIAKINVANGVTLTVLGTPYNANYQ